MTIIYIHDAFPDPYDAFYSPASADVDALVSYYGIISDPTLIISGVNAGANLSDWKTITTEAASQSAPPEKLSLSSINNPNGTLSVKVNITGSRPSSTVKLNVMIIESGIVYDNSKGVYGNPPNNTWNNIFRKMLPGSSGSTPFVLTHDTSFVYTFDPTGTNWNVANLHVVAYLQDTKTGTNGTHLIYGNTASGNSFFQSGVANQMDQSSQVGNITSNPFSTSTRIPLHLSQPSYVKAEVFSSLGVKVATLVDQMINEQDVMLAFYPLDLCSGVYYIHVMTGGKLAAVRPVIYQR
ncbi:MAG: Omp28-related outer membrane protein [Candidatus Kapaibacterium sp.]